VAAGFARLARLAREAAPVVESAGVLKPAAEASLRPEQRPPPGLWRLWQCLAGRGWGKSQAGSHFALDRAERWPGSRGAIAAATHDDLVKTCLYGESGIMSLAARPPRHVKGENPRLVWPNGSSALLLTAEKPDRARGPNLHWCWGDETMAWPKLDQPGSLWHNIEMALRLPARKGWVGYPGPQVCVTTTPRGRQWLRKKVAEWEAAGGVWPGNAVAGGIALTRGRTLDNAANLDPTFLADLVARYSGTAWGRQELEGLLLLDAEGALWSSDLIATHRRSAHPPLVYVAVGVDPSVGEGSEKADACGIVAAGVCERGEVWVLADHTLNAPPGVWARKTDAARELHRANMVVPEKNQGGKLVEDALRNVNANMPITTVHASESKRARAEPIAGLYEQGLVHHVGDPAALLALEQEMTGWDAWSEKSPNRIDALVWVITHLLPFVRGGQASAERAALALKAEQERQGVTAQALEAAELRAMLTRQAGLDGSGRRRGRR
jgi:phage terminase large subunit-like protein